MWAGQTTGPFHFSEMSDAAVADSRRGRLTAMSGPFPVDADIARAETPPGSFYCDPAVYAAARERVFRRSWQLVADSDAMKVPGQVHPFTLLEGCLDEPLLLTRDHPDRVHCLSNVCTHRGTVLCPGAGHEKSLVCRYHGRRFDLDGTFRYMPEPPWNCHWNVSTNTPCWCWMVTAASTGSRCRIASSITLVPTDPR